MEAIELKELQKPLLPSQIYFMPKSVMKWGDNVHCQIIPYKDARSDMERLDLTCGADWQNEYKRDSSGVLQCGIGIFINERGEWVWRWSNGVPSQFEKLKGEYSDAFKRAGIMWGIGRELYDFPKIRIILNQNEYRMDDNGKPKIKSSFDLNGQDFDWKMTQLDGIGVKVVMKWKGKERFNSHQHRS